MHHVVVMLTAILAPSLAGAPSRIDDTALIRRKKQIYLCGAYPNQYYSTARSTVLCVKANRYFISSAAKLHESFGMPYLCTLTRSCTHTYWDFNILPNSDACCGACRVPTLCTNGGVLLNVGCTFSAQCTPFYRGVTTCINGCCCTVPNPSQPSTHRFGYCPSGQLSEVRCNARSQCQPGQTCMTGLCCTITGNEWNEACGGMAALGSCTNGACTSGVCTSSNYCCECPVGRSGGRCYNGICPSGFVCQPNGFCCPQCPNNVMPFGACRNGVCGGGTTCRAGNICC